MNEIENSGLMSSDKICVLLRGRKGQFKGVELSNLRAILARYAVEGVKQKGSNFQDSIGAVVQHFQDAHDKLKNAGKEKQGRLRDAQADREEMKTLQLADQIIPKTTHAAILKDWAAKTSVAVGSLRLSTKDRDAVLAVMKKSLEDVADALEASDK